MFFPSKVFLALTLFGTLALSQGAAAQTEGFAPACGIAPSCDATPPRIAAHGHRALFGNPKHFGRDFYLNETDEQWVIAKFQYSAFLKYNPLVHSEVVIQLLRDCGSTWETLGTALTTAPGEHPTTLGVADDGGLVYFQIPEDKRLGLGRHRVRLVATSDGTATELFLEVLPRGSSIFVSDVDGTLTTSELVEALDGILNKIPEAHDGAAPLYQGLVAKGYHPLYLTARASNLVQRTREFLTARKFPNGVVQTSAAPLLGLSGNKGAAFKAAVLQDLEDRGFHIAYGFGNTDVDAKAFASIDLPDAGKYFYDYPGYSAYGGGQDFSDYKQLEDVKAAADLCKDQGAF